MSVQNQFRAPPTETSVCTSCDAPRVLIIVQCRSWRETSGLDSLKVGICVLCNALRTPLQGGRKVSQCTCRTLPVLSWSSADSFTSKV